MSIVVEPLISALVEHLVSIVNSFLSSKLKIFDSKRKQIVTEIEKWKAILEDLCDFLRDADDKKQNNPAVKRWLEELEELTYDAEDIIEEFNYGVLLHEVEHAEGGRSGEPSNLKKWKQNMPNIFRSGNSSAYSDLPGKLNEVTKKFQCLKDRKSELNLLILPIISSTRLESRIELRHPTGPIPTEPVIYGRDDDKRAIIRILKEQGESKIGVVPIVGMGGLGKTTLARYVYNDEEIKGLFDVLGWVCVSGDCDMKKIMKDILESISDNYGDIKDKALGWIQVKLAHELRNKKFLLVLDDNWNDDYNDWNTLSSVFNEGSIGSKIIVTTRSQNVADKVMTVPCIIPNLLNEDDCWSLFCIHACLNPNGSSLFQNVGKKIAKKCSGLPLAAMTVGGMLRNKVRVEEWEEIQNSMTWTLENVISVLKMSYNDLTSQLKRCFAFFSLFPEDYTFSEDEVVLLWIGEGLIQTLKGEKSIEEVAHNCFHKLLSRSLFSPVMKNEGKQLYMMHDLVRDLARQVASMNLYIGKDDNIVFKGTRHLSFHRSRFQNIIEGITELGKDFVRPLRTVLPLDGFVSVEDLPNLIDTMFLSLKYVRALSLERLKMEKLPESVSKMKLLRYLNLSDSHIVMFPTSFTSLYNLEILILRSCFFLKQLPERIEKLIHLWYLDITDCSLLKELPEGIKELKRLQKLTHFIVNEKLSVAFLGNLHLLRGSLEISGLGNVTLYEEASLAQLSEKRLDELVLIWDDLVLPWGCERWEEHYRNIEEQRQTGYWREVEILTGLQPHESLKQLRICYYGGEIFPFWFPRSVTSLTVLELIDCRSTFPPLTLHDLVSLEELTVINCSNIAVYLPMMPNLKKLHLERCCSVDCSENFCTDAMKVLVVLNDDGNGKQEIEMSPLFKERVSLGCPNASHLYIGHFNIKKIPRWVLPDITFMADNYEEEMKVEELRIEKFEGKKLPLWVSNAKYLKEVHVCRCPSLKELLPNGDFPPSLAKIVITGCTQLTSILSQDALPERALSLKLICVGGCPSLKVMLPADDISIEYCQSLESFHEDAPPHSIKHLRIDTCPLLSQKLQDRDERQWSKISPLAHVFVDWRQTLRY